MSALRLPPKRLPVLHRVPRFKDANKTEILFFRSRLGELRNVSITRSPTNVHGEKPKPGDRFSIHTHIVSNPRRRPDKGVRGLPSITDICGMLQYFTYLHIEQETRGKDLRNWFVISMNSRKKATGFFAFRPRKEVVEGFATGKGVGVRVFATTKGEIDDYLSGVMYRPQKWINKKEEDIVREILDKLFDAGLIMHAIPAKGYRFNGRAFVLVGKGNSL